MPAHSKSEEIKMAQNTKLIEEYEALLKKNLVTVAKSHRYGEILGKYNALRKRINGILEESGAICNDCDALVDKNSAALKTGAEALIASNPDIRDMLEELIQLCAALKEFEPDGWTDDTMYLLSPVMTIASCRDIEKEILAELGRDAGQHLIRDVKAGVLPFEEELGLTFFKDDVERLTDLFRTKTLFPVTDEIELDYFDNLEARPIKLKNAEGEIFNFEKAAEMRYLGSVYLELELLDDLKVGKFNYYKLEKRTEGQRLTLVEDKDTNDDLEDIRERLCIRFQR